MKKSIMVIIFSCQLAAFSQKPWLGFQSGFGFSSMDVTTDYGKSSSQKTMGFTTGVIVDLALSDRFSIQPGLNFIQKGGSREGNIYTGTEKLETVLNYIEVPVNVIFYTKPQKQGFFAGAGLNPGFGISGFREIGAAVTWLGNEVEDIRFGNAEDDHMKPFELGANLLLGYSFKRGLFLSATGNFGLTNVSNQSDANIKNRYIALRIGWLIRRNA